MKEEPLSVLELKNLLNGKLSSQLSEYGLSSYNGEYLWYSKFNENGYRKIFNYQKLKGNSGTFRWGYCFNYIPTITRTKTIKHHRTDKSITFHLWDEPINLINFNGGKFMDFREKGMVSHWGNSEFGITFNNLYEDCQLAISNWFELERNDKDLLKVIDYQLEYGKRYKSRHPSQKYISAFIHAKSGRLEEALELINESKRALVLHNSQWTVPYEKIKHILKKVATDNTV